MKKAVPVCLGALLLVVSGCGGETRPSQTEDGKKIVSSVSKALTDATQGIATKDARCIATRFVDDLGVDAVVKSKVVSKGLAYADGSLPEAKGATAIGYVKARAHCLEDKIATSMTGVIATKDGLLDTKSAACVAKNFTHGAGYDNLVAGKAVTTQLAYVSNGAIQEPGNAATYAEALTKCVARKAVTSTLSKAVETAFASGAGGPAAGNFACVVKDFVKDVGIKGLMTNKMITDTGVFNTGGAKYDTPSATSLATAILGCVDALKSQAETAANADKTLDVTKLEACLKKAISSNFLRDDFLVNQLIGNDAKAQAAAAAVQSKSQACEDQQK